MKTAGRVCVGGLCDSVIRKGDRYRPIRARTERHGPETAIRLPAGKVCEACSRTGS